MKKFFMILVTLVFLVGCATSGIPTRQSYMKRAEVFDNSQRGLERTTEYQACYADWFNYLMDNCVGPVMDRYEPGEVPDDDPYWQCCDDALDEFVDCLGGE